MKKFKATYNLQINGETPIEKIYAVGAKNLKAAEIKIQEHMQETLTTAMGQDVNKKLLSNRASVKDVRIAEVV